MHQGRHALIHFELVTHIRPSGNHPVVPFRVELLHAQIEQLEHGCLIGKRALLRHLAKAGVHALDGIRRVHQFPHGPAVIVQLLDVREVVLPDAQGARIGRPVLSERFEVLPRLLDVDGAVQRPQFLREAAPFLAGDIFRGIADQMHDAALHDDVREDGLRAGFEAADAVDGKEAEVFHAA